MVALLPNSFPCATGHLLLLHSLFPPFIGSINLQYSSKFSLSISPLCVKQKPAESVPFDRDSSFDYYHKMSRLFFVVVLFRSFPSCSANLAQGNLRSVPLICRGKVSLFASVCVTLLPSPTRLRFNFGGTLWRFWRTPQFRAEEVGRREGKLDGERFGRSKSQIEIIALNKQSRCQVFSHELYGLSGGDGLSQTGSGPRVRLVLWNNLFTGTSDRSQWWCEKEVESLQACKLKLTGIPGWEVERRRLKISARSLADLWLERFWFFLVVVVGENCAPFVFTRGKILLCVMGPKWPQLGGVVCFSKWVAKSSTNVFIIRFKPKLLRWESYARMTKWSCQRLTAELSTDASTLLTTAC